MKTFKELYEACCAACEKRAEIEEVKEPTGDLKDACWKGYTAVGMKMKNGRKVPNCVPVKEEVEQIDEDLHPKLTKAAEVLRSAGHVISHIGQGYHKKTRKKIGLIRYTDSNTGGKIAKNVQLEEVEQIDEMDKTQSQQGGHGVTEPYDYGKGKWSKAEIMTNKEVAKKVKFDVGKLLKVAREKKKIKEEVEQIDEIVMPYMHNPPRVIERTPEQEKKHAERKAEKYLHMPGKNAARSRKYWVKKVNKLHGIPEEVGQIDEISKDLASRYLRKIERQPGLDKDHPDKRKPNKFGSQKIGYERAFNKVSPFGKHRVKVQATEEVNLDEADMSTLRKQLAKHTELAVKANKAGDDALTKKHQGHVNKIKERMTKLVKEQIDEATFQGKEVPLNKPMAGDVKKSKVYVDPDGDGKAQKVNFGDKNMTIKKHIPGRRKNFRARHNCDNPGPKTKARYWSCRAW